MQSFPACCNEGFRVTLEQMKAGTFTFKLRALEDLLLPAYKGSTLRGGFGTALKNVVCALRRQECKLCLLHRQCVYVYLFETPPGNDSEMMRLYPAAPHPFVIDPPRSDLRRVAAGESIEFGLVLIGRALDYLAHFIYAFIRLGENGLGSARGKFELIEVLAAGVNGPSSIYRGSEQILKQPPIVDVSSTIAARARDFSGARLLTCKFLTPTRIKFAERLVEKPQFHHLIRSLVRRISSLCYFHCGEKLNMDFRGIIERAESISGIDWKLRWVDWERYSTRQKQRMTLGGFVGAVTFRGDFTEFLPLLAVGEIFHLGKGATFGLGKYAISPGNESESC